MPPDPGSDLAKEVRHLHRAFFRGDPPAQVVERYIAAHQLLLITDSALVNTVVGLQLDPEAVELALRVRQGPTLLTKKIRILFYLLEVRSDYFGFFVGALESRWRATFGLILSFIQTGAKYLKGAYLVRRHRLV